MTLGLDLGQRILSAGEHVPLVRAMPTYMAPFLVRAQPAGRNLLVLDVCSDGSAMLGVSIGSPSWLEPCTSQVPVPPLLGRESAERDTTKGKANPPQRSHLAYARGTAKASVRARPRSP